MILANLCVSPKGRDKPSRRMLKLVFANCETPAPRRGRKVNEWLDDSGATIGRAYSSDDSHWIDWPGLGVFAFSARSHDVRVWLEPDVLHEAITDAFARMLQPVILQALGRQALHAGAALGPAGVVAFCGKAGSGKSTLAFAMQHAGWRQFADDALVLRLDRGPVTACQPPFTPRLRPASRAHFGSRPLPPSVEQQPADAPLRAIFILQQESALTSHRIALISQARAFSELLAHAHCFDADDPTHMRRLAESYLELAARVPVFTLAYQPRLQHLSELTDAVIKTAANIGARTVLSSKLRPAV